MPRRPSAIVVRIPEVEKLFLSISLFAKKTPAHSLKVAKWKDGMSISTRFQSDLQPSKVDTRNGSVYKDISKGVLMFQADH